MWGQIWGQVGNPHRANLIQIRALEFKCDSLHRSSFLRKLLISFDLWINSKTANLIWDSHWDRVRLKMAAITQQMHRQRRGNAFYFRIAVSLPLHDRFGREYKCSLKGNQRDTDRKRHVFPSHQKNCIFDPRACYLWAWLQDKGQLHRRAYRVYS